MTPVFALAACVLSQCHQKMCKPPSARNLGRRRVVLLWCPELGGGSRVRQLHYPSLSQVPDGKDSSV